MNEDRIYLNVPFEEKDEAKKLGARWDAAKKHWWIPDRAANKQPFEKWLSSSSENAPIFLDIDQANWDISDIELMRQVPELGEIIVFIIPTTCWKCNQTTWTFHASIDEEGTGLLGGIEVTALMYWPDVLTEIDEARARFGLPRMGVIKPRFSKTVGAKYVSQGCAHCDAIVGAFPLHEDFITISSEGGLPDYKFKMYPHWPPEDLDEWIDDNPEVMHVYDDDDSPITDRAN